MVGDYVISLSTLKYLVTVETNKLVFSVALKGTSTRVVLMCFNTVFISLCAILKQL